MLTDYRKQQILFLLTDIISSLLVWLCFLLFRWLVYDGRVFGVETVLIPAFDFYRPLLLYPAGCLAVYYLSGYYLHPLHRRLTHDMLTTVTSAAVIALGAFFVIIIDDRVENYHRYLGSLVVLFVLQAGISGIMRLAVTLFTRRHLPEPPPVIIDLPEETGEQELFARIREAYPTGRDIVVKPRVKDLLTGAARIRDLRGEAMIRITDQHMSNAELCIKRAFDVAAAVTTLLLLSPLYAGVALIVRLTSKGPVIYRQERVGLHGLPFHILKFRTMYIDAEAGIPQLTDNKDPRVTPVGHLLRKYRIDELPQMWNVLCGHMSVVGPRPERPYFIRQIEQRAPYYCLLYKIRPGLTSWGPIKVGYADTIGKMVDRLNYDIAYMENMSLVLDLKIMFYTVGVILAGKGK